MKTLGESIAAARNAAGMKQEMLGGMLGVVCSTISSWERDRTEPSFKELHQIADACGTTVSKMLQPINPYDSPAIDQIHALGQKLSVETGTDELIDMSRQLHELIHVMLDEKYQALKKIASLNNM